MESRLQNSFADIIRQGEDALKATTSFDECISDIVKQVLDGSMSIADAVTLFHSVDFTKCVDIDPENVIVDTLWLAGTQVIYNSLHNLFSFSNLACDSGASVERFAVPVVDD